MVPSDEAVSLLLVGEGSGGETTVSLGVEAFRDSQENGLVSLRVLGAGAGVARFSLTGACGGAAQGTEGRTPDKPVREDLLALTLLLEDARGGGSGFWSRTVGRSMLAKDYETPELLTFR